LTITAQKNADQLRDLEAQFTAKLNEVIQTKENAQSRVDLGDLAAAAGNPEVARSIYLAATYIDKSFESAVEEKLQALYQPLPILVPLVQLDGNGNIEPPAAEPAPKADPASETPPKEDATEAPKGDAKDTSTPDAAKPETTPESGTTPEPKADAPAEPAADAPAEPKADAPAGDPEPGVTPEPAPKE
jgi:hypothetical protein